jgi:outer membrane lipoprotein-sorting protein
MMDNRTIIKAVLIMLGMVGFCAAASCTESAGPERKKDAKPDPVGAVLTQLKQKTEKLESYQAGVEYLSIEPFPDFNSQTLRKGLLYYQKSGEKSKLRLNFQTLKQDDEKQQKYVQQFIFDGVWLTRIDYQLEHVTRKQLVEPNEPVDAFELVRRNFPIIGFTKVQELKKDFEIELIEQIQTERAAFIQLHMTVKRDSPYKDDYTTIDFWIDAKSGLPARIVAETTEEDIYEIKFLKPKVNKKIEEKVFDYRIPEGFTKEDFPLEKPKPEESQPKGAQKGQKP